MVSIALTNLGLYAINQEQRLNQQSIHPSHAGKIFDFSSYISNSLLNEYLVIYFHTIIFGSILYLVLSTTSYIFFFKLTKEKYLPSLKTNKFKIAHDIKWSLINIWVEALLVSLLRMAIPRYSFIYFEFSELPYWVIPISIICHLIWDETLTYWAHRFLHTYRWLYLKLHIVHHRSIDVTPYAGFAFHPIDAFLQALPTFTSCFIFPIHYDIFLAFSIATTIWAISIHDNVPAMPCKLFLYATHHTIHHERGNGSFRNYGKFTSVWDRLMGTYEDPDRIYYGWTAGSQVKFFEKFNNALTYYLNEKLAKAD